MEKNIKYFKKLNLIVELFLNIYNSNRNLQL